MASYGNPSDSSALLCMSHATLSEEFSYLLFVLQAL